MRYLVIGPGSKAKENAEAELEELEILEAFEEAAQYLDGLEDDDLFFDTID